MALLRLLNEEVPQLLQVCESLLNNFSIGAALCDNVLTPLKNVINTRLVALDFFLKGLHGRKLIDETMYK